jgi:hypothetical protein
MQQQKMIEFIRQGRITEALMFAQEELAPRGEESPEFLAELERTMALLAFESSPTAPPEISDLLSPGQRMKTAGEVNAAILESLSQGKEVKLVGLLKLLCWGESLLEERAEFPKVRMHFATFLSGADISEFIPGGSTGWNVVAGKGEGGDCPIGLRDFCVFLCTTTSILYNICGGAAAPVSQEAVAL